MTITARTAARTAAAVAAALLLSACAEPSAPPPATVNAVNAVNAADTACLRDVAATTGNKAVRVVGTTAGPTDTEVIVGVGPTGQWRCIAHPDGTTSGIMSITNEGTL